MPPTMLTNTVETCETSKKMLGVDGLHLDDPKEGSTEKALPGTDASKSHHGWVLLDTERASKFCRACSDPQVAGSCPVKVLPRRFKFRRLAGRLTEGRFPAQPAVGIEPTFLLDKECTVGLSEHIGLGAHTDHVNPHQRLGSKNSSLLVGTKKTEVILPEAPSSET